MLCPICNSKLSCQDSRQIDSVNRYREYACLKCEIVFMSNEKLETESIRKKIQNRLKEKKEKAWTS